MGVCARLFGFSHCFFLEGGGVCARWGYTRIFAVHNLSDTPPERNAFPSVVRIKFSQPVLLIPNSNQLLLLRGFVYNCMTWDRSEKKNILVTKLVVAGQAEI